MENNIMKAMKAVFGRRFEESLAKAIVLSVVLFSLTACPPFGPMPAPPGSPECVEADEWGATENIELKVKAENEYTSAGIKVRQSEPLEIKIGGMVDLCADNKIFRPVGYERKDLEGIPVAYMYPITPTDYNWQEAKYKPAGAPDSAATGVWVEKGDKFSITVNDAYHDRNGNQDEGKGLYVYIGDTPPPASDNPNIQDAWWYGAQGAPQPEENKMATTAGGGAFPEFFELYDNGTTGAGGFSGIAPKSGYLWFRYARNASVHGLKQTGGDQYSPWLGEYAWTDATRCNVCRQTVIQLTCIAALFLYPVCVTAWEAGCAADGYLEEAYWDKFGSTVDVSGRNCREHYTSQDMDSGTGGIEGNHWIDSKYDGSQSDSYLQSSKGNTANSGGYEISIGSGCIGTYGKFMEMQIGSSEITLHKKTTPEGCTEGQVGCTVVMDDWGGLPVFVAKYSLPDPNITSMDMRGPAADGWTDPGGYKRVGEYSSQVPASGELWFKIVDKETSAAHPQPGYYGDNFGSYKVRIKTTKVNTGFSDFLQNIINPVKGMIFGYCRVQRLDSFTNDASLMYKINELDCANLDYVDFAGKTHPAWQPGITRRMYNKLVGGYLDSSTNKIVGNPFMSALRAALILYVVLYGGMFMMGMVADKQEDFLKRVIKVSIIAILISENSWDFFNNYLFTFFTNGMDELIFKFTSEFNGANPTLTLDPTGQVDMTDRVATTGNIFAFADLTIDKFFQQATWIKIAGLLFSSPIGFVYIILIIAGMAMFVFAIFKSLILYLLACLAIALLLIVAPLFLSFVLFDRTRSLFEGWLKNLINYALQPVLVLTALALFNVFIFSSIYTMLHYRVCWQTVWYIKIADLDLGPLLNFYMPSPSVYDVMASGGLQGLDIPIQFFMVLIFIILCDAMLKFIDWMADLTSYMTFGQKSGSLAEAAQKAMMKGVDVAKKVWSYTYGRGQQMAQKSMEKVTEQAKNAAKNAAKRAGGAKGGDSGGAKGGDSGSAKGGDSGGSSKPSSGGGKK